MIFIGSVSVPPALVGRRLSRFLRGPVAYVETIADLAEYRVSGVHAGLHEREFFPGEAGLLGTGILSHFTITVDAPLHACQEKLTVAPRLNQVPR